MIVSEKDIEHILQHLENNGEMVDTTIEKKLNRFPPVTHYLMQVDRDILTELEYYQMLVGAVVVLMAFEKTNPEGVPEDILDVLSEKEDQNWTLMLAQKGTFHQKLDAFFADYPEEDLLAFIEDSLYEDEGENELTPVGREVIFIKLKTLVDVLFVASK